MVWYVCNGNPNHKSAIEFGMGCVNGSSTLASVERNNPKCYMQWLFGKRQKGRGFLPQRIKGQVSGIRFRSGFVLYAFFSYASGNDPYPAFCRIPQPSNDDHKWSLGRWGSEWSLVDLIFINLHSNAFERIGSIHWNDWCIWTKSILIQKKVRGS